MASTEKPHHLRFQSIFLFLGMRRSGCTKLWVHEAINLQELSLKQDWISELIGRFCHQERPSATCQLAPSAWNCRCSWGGMHHLALGRLMIFMFYRVQTKLHLHVESKVLPITLESGLWNFDASLTTASSHRATSADIALPRRIVLLRVIGRTADACF